MFNYEKFIDNGYNKRFLNQSFHSMFSLPFFLFLMTALASILTMNTLKKSDNLNLFIWIINLCIIIFYFKDLSIALGQTDRIPLNFGGLGTNYSIEFFTFIGVLQINEK